MHLLSSASILKADTIPTDLGTGSVPTGVAAVFHQLLSWGIGIGLILIFGGFLFGIVKLIEAHQSHGKVEGKGIIIALVAAGLVVGSAGLYNTVIGVA